jgi:hypothetical protein
MRIALDYDGTFTEDRGFWTEFISRAQDRGHTIHIVTFRTKGIDDIPEEQELKSWMDVETVYTDRNAKRRFCDEQGLQIDVWIDDQPELIVNESTWDAKQLAAWRAENEAKINDDTLKIA